MTTSAFVSGKGFLYHYDPRAKLFNLILITILVFIPTKTITLWALASVIFLLTVYSVGLKQAYQPLRAILFLLVIMVLIIPFTYRDSLALLKIGNFVVVTVDGLKNFGLLSLRLIAITYLATLFIYTTPIADIQLALRWYALPYSATLVITLAFRFIPFVANTFNQIQDSHKLREIDLGKSKKSLFRISDTVTTVTAALVFALKSIPYMAMSLEHRGFGSSSKRTNFRVLKPKGSLALHFLIAISLNLILLVLFMFF